MSIPANDEQLKKINSDFEQSYAIVKKIIEADEKTGKEQLADYTNKYLEKYNELLKSYKKLLKIHDRKMKLCQENSDLWLVHGDDLKALIRETGDARIFLQKRIAQIENIKVDKDFLRGSLVKYYELLDKYKDMLSNPEKYSFYSAPVFESAKKLAYQEIQEHLQNMIYYASRYTEEALNKSLDEFDKKIKQVAGQIKSRSLPKAAAQTPSSAATAAAGSSGVASQTSPSAAVAILSPATGRVAVIPKQPTKREAELITSYVNMTGQNIFNAYQFNKEIGEGKQGSEMQSQYKVDEEFFKITLQPETSRGNLEAYLKEMEGLSNEAFPGWDTTLLEEVKQAIRNNLEIFNYMMQGMQKNLVAVIKKNNQNVATPSPPAAMSAAGSAGVAAQTSSSAPPLASSAKADLEPQSVTTKDMDLKLISEYLKMRTQWDAKSYYSFKESEGFRASTTKNEDEKNYLDDLLKPETTQENLENYLRDDRDVVFDFSREEREELEKLFNQPEVNIVEELKGAIRRNFIAFNTAMQQMKGQLVATLRTSQNVAPPIATAAPAPPKAAEIAPPKANGAAIPSAALAPISPAAVVAPGVPSSGVPPAQKISEAVVFSASASGVANKDASKSEKEKNDKIADKVDSELENEQNKKIAAILKVNTEEVYNIQPKSIAQRFFAYKERKEQLENIENVKDLLRKNIGLSPEDRAHLLYSAMKNTLTELYKEHEKRRSKLFGSKSRLETVLEGETKKLEEFFPAITKQQVLNNEEIQKKLSSTAAKKPSM